MSYACKIVADSIGPSGCRVTTLEVTYPLFVHAEHLRHRVFSFSVASNRAIPTSKILRQVIDDPVVPVWFGKNQPGMSAHEELSGWRYMLARRIWLAARWPMIAIVWLLLRIGLHKQLANRILSPWQWVTLLVTGTEWENFFALRCHPDAQPEMRRIAEMMRDAMAESKSERLRAGELHIPLCDGHAYWNITNDQKLMVSASRCARFSILSDKQLPWQEEVAKAEKLLSSGHMSPFEHQAQALVVSKRFANYRGWQSFRSTIPNESNFARLVR
jgi:hypothetical protein